MPPDTAAPFDRHGLRINWGGVFKILGLLLPVVLVGVMLYLGREFASHAELAAAVAPSAPLPARVQSLEEFRGRQELQQLQTAAVISVIQQDLSAIKALQTEATRNTDRILRKLDSQPQH